MKKSSILVIYVIIKPHNRQILRPILSHFIRKSSIFVFFVIIKLQQRRLKAHIESVQKKIMYPCNFCSILCSSMGSLKRHLNRHSFFKT